MAVVGMSLHTVQDFYAHISCVETAGELGSPDGPGWSARCTVGPYHAVVDPMDQVKESNENNNTADVDVIC